VQRFPLQITGFTGNSGSSIKGCLSGGSGDFGTRKKTLSSTITTDFSHLAPLQKEEVDPDSFQWLQCPEKWVRFGNNANLITCEMRPIPSAMSTNMCPVESTYPAIPLRKLIPKSQERARPPKAKPALIFKPMPD